MAVVRDGGSSSGRGGTNTRRADNPLPHASVEEPTATSRSPRGSSSSRSEASGGTARRAADAEGLSKQVVPGATDLGGHGGSSRRSWSSSCGDRAASSSRHHPASPPVSSRGGGYGRKYHDGDDDSSFVKPPPVYGQESSSIRGNFMKPSSAELNIRQQAASSASLPERRDATNMEISPKVSEEESEAIQVPPGFFQGLRNVGSPDATSEERSCNVLEVEKQCLTDGKLLSRADYIKSSIKMENVTDQKSNIATLLEMKDCNSKSGDTFEGRNNSEDSKKPSSRPRICFALNPPKRPSISGSFFEKYHAPATEEAAADAEKQKPKPRKYSSDHGVDGDPHPPPFYKCEVCCRRTALYMLQCCSVAICDRCGCNCEDCTHREQLHMKNKLPEVRLEGYDLFLWTSFDFPPRLMLFKAKRTGNQLRYYFGSIKELTDQNTTGINATVYTFQQEGRKVKSIEVTNGIILRTALY